MSLAKQYENVSQNVCGITAEIGQLEAEIKLREMQMRRLPKLLTKIQLMILKRKQTLSRLASQAEELKAMAKKTALPSQTQKVSQAQQSFDELNKRFQALTVASEKWSDKIAAAKEDTMRLQTERVVEIGRTVAKDELQVLEQQLDTMRSENSQAQEAMSKMTKESQLLKVECNESADVASIKESAAVKKYLVREFSLQSKRYRDGFAQKEVSLQQESLKGSSEFGRLEKDRNALKVSIREALEEFSTNRQNLLVEEKRIRKDIEQLTSGCSTLKHGHKTLISSKSKQALELKKQTELLNSFKTKCKLLQMELGMLKGKDIAQTSLTTKLTKEIALADKDIEDKRIIIKAIKFHMETIIAKPRVSLAPPVAKEKDHASTGGVQMQALLKTKTLLQSKIQTCRAERKSQHRRKPRGDHEAKPVQRTTRNSSRQRSLKRKEKRELQRKKRAKKKSAQLIDLFNDDVFS